MAATNRKGLEVDISKWAKRNAWSLPSGETCVRPGLVRLFDSSNNPIVGAFSVQNPRTTEMWHYIIRVDQATGLSPSILVYDEDWQLIQNFAIGTTQRPRIVTYGVVEDELFINSPDFPMIWGVVGSGLVRAVAVASLIPNEIVLAPPQGLTVAWGGRCVVASGQGLQFSDAGRPRTWDPVNIANPSGGAIFGLHVNAQGDLFICTTTGVYSLPVEAAVSGLQVISIWDKVSDHVTTDYGCSAVSREALYGLTERGIRRLGQQTASEVLLDDPPSGSLDQLTPIVHPDYRVGTLLGGSKGPMVSIEDHVWVSDPANSLMSWWSPPEGSLNNPFKVVGLCYDRDGAELLVTQSFVQRLYGNRDAVQTPSTPGNPVQASIFGLVDNSPADSFVVRVLQWKTDSTRTFAMFVNEKQGVGPIPDAFSPTASVDSWDSGVVYSREYTLQVVRNDFAYRTDNVSIQIRLTGSGFRIGLGLDMFVAGPGKYRRP